MRFESREQIAEFVPLGTLKTSRVGSVAVKLNYFFLGNAGSLMQAVDVLSDDARDFTLRDEMRDRAMPSV